MPKKSTNPDFVDLGLPSGTLWSENQEPRKYSFEEAQEKFHKKLPTSEQWQELVRHCTWEWTPDGFLVHGQNGNVLCMPADILFPFRGKRRYACITRLWLASKECRLTASFFDNHIYRRTQALLQGNAHVRTVLATN